MSRMLLRWAVATALTSIVGPAVAQTTRTPGPESRVHATQFQIGPLSPQTARAIRLGEITLSGTAGGPISPPALNCKPAPCLLPNVQASEGGQPVNQTSVVVDPSNPKHVLVAGGDYNCSPSLQGYFASKNGSKTFTHTCGTLADDATAGDGDPIIGWDLNGVAYRGGIDATSASEAEIVVDKSTDFGTTWSSPVVAAKVSGVFMDRP